MTISKKSMPTITFKLDRKSIFRFLLYLFLLLEIIGSIIYRYYGLAIILGIGALGILVIRRRFPNQTEMYWMSVKDKLHLILVKNKIIDPPSNETWPSNVKDDALILMEDESLNLPIGADMVEQLRIVGIDGLLICLFLLKYDDVYCSIKSVLLALPIPKTTVYRSMQKLIDYNYVQSKNTLQNPNQNYYQLTLDGKYLVFELHKLIKLTV